VQQFPLPAVLVLVLGGLLNTRGPFCLVCDMEFQLAMTESVTAAEHPRDPSQWHSCLVSKLFFFLFKCKTNEKTFLFGTKHSCVLMELLSFCSMVLQAISSMTCCTDSTVEAM